MSISDIPGRAFLDTSVVNFMLDYGEQIHNNVPVPTSATERVVQDVESLRKVYFVGQRASWQFAISPSTYREVISTAEPSRRYYLENWFFEIWHYWRDIIEHDNDLPELIEAERTRVELLASGVLDALPEVEDRNSGL